MASTSACDIGSGVTSGSAAAAQAPLGVGVPVLLVGEVAPADRIVGGGCRAAGIEHVRVGGGPLARQVPLAAVDLHQHPKSALRALVVTTGVWRVPHLDEVLDRGRVGAVE